MTTKHNAKYTKLADMSSGDYRRFDGIVDYFAGRVMNDIKTSSMFPWHIFVQPDPGMKDLVLTARNPNTGHEYVEFVMTMDPHLKDDDCLATTFPDNPYEMLMAHDVGRVAGTLLAEETNGALPCTPQLRKHIYEMILGIVGELDDSYRYCIMYEAGYFMILTGASPNSDLSFELSTRTMRDFVHDRRVARLLNAGKLSEV